MEISKQKYDTLEEVNNIIFSNHLKNNNKINNIIFIYTPPKVGSTSLVSSLRISANHKYSIVHIHDDIMLNSWTGYRNITVNELINFNKLIGRNVIVIDIYRSPLERKMSEYFEKIAPYHFNNTEENINSYNIQKVIDRFNNIFPYIANNDYFQEIYQISTPGSYDFNKKYLLVEHKGIKYIKLRLKDSLEWGKILSSILNTEIVIIKDYNTENKTIGNLYKKFKDTYKIPMNLFLLIENCKYLKYYYTQDERKQYLDDLSKKTTKSINPFSSSEYIFYMKICNENKFYNDFQSDHYIDMGCVCIACSKKRREIFNRVKQGHEIKEKIVHDELVLDLKKNVLNSISNKIKDSLKKKNIIRNSKGKNSKTISNYMNNIINK